MSENKPTTPEGCRAMAIECGRRATSLMSVGEHVNARAQIERARELTVLALKLEAALSAHKPSSPGASA